MADERELNDLLAQLERLGRVLYSRGFNDGALAARESILKAASAPLSVSISARGEGGAGSVVSAFNESRVPASEKVAESASPTPSGRAPRGLVGRVITEVLTQEQPLSIIQVEDRVTERYPQISRKTVGNELRRQEGEAYERRGKYSWFLKGKAPKETAEPSHHDGPADEPRSSTKGLEDLI